MLALEVILSNYPEDQWVHVFADTLATEDTDDGGRGIYVECNDKAETHKLANEKWPINSKAEKEEVIMAEEIKEKSSNRKDISRQTYQPLPQLK